MKPFSLLLLLCVLISCSKSEVLENENPNSDSESILEDGNTDPAPIIATPCVDGMAGIFPCSGYDLLANISLATFESESGSDSWGWTDPETGKEIALMGLYEGTAFVDISDPENPIILGKLLAASVESQWRDIKVFNDHAFIVSEAPGHGLQVFDLTRLRNATQNEIFTADVHLTDFGNAHNIAINESTGFAYVVGNNDLYKGGPIFIDINDPKNPVLAGGYADASYTHDLQAVIYQGPDTKHQGKELLFASNSDGGANNQLVVLDVTDKSNPQRIKNITYANGGYTHQAWLTEDHAYILLGDELDEYKYGSPTQTRVFDIRDIENATLFHDYFGPTNAIDHNGYVNGTVFYLANYSAGFRAIDLSNLAEKEMSETGFFDTYPNDDATDFTGVWNVYPYFKSGVILISDINSGLFLVKASN